MRRSLFILILLVGCAQSPLQPQTQQQLQDRYASADEIINVSERDTALYKIAVDAADANNEEMAVKAVSDMSSLVQRDDAEDEAARKFDQLGNRPAAEKLGSMISNVVIRDQLHTKFAGEAPTPSSATKP